MPNEFQCSQCGTTVIHKNEGLYERVICEECKKRRKKFWCDACKSIFSTDELPAPNIGNLEKTEIEHTSLEVLQRRPKTISVEKLQKYSTWRSSSLFNNKIHSLIQLAEKCPNCRNPLNIGWEYETVNWARLVFLSIILLFGILGINLNNEPLQVIGFGIIFVYFFVGLTFFKTLRWIFMHWVEQFEPSWYKKRRFAQFRKTFAYALLKESAVAIGILIIFAVITFFEWIGKQLK